MSYKNTKQFNGSFEDAVKKTRETLATEGFGILTEIDVKATLKKKLDVDFGNYVILGACNPPFAYEALKAEIEIGLLLPCNVIIYAQNEKVFVSAIVPSVAMGIVENSALEDIAHQVEEKLKKVMLLI